MFLWVFTGYDRDIVIASPIYWSLITHVIGVSKCVSIKNFSVGVCLWCTSLIFFFFSESNELNLLYNLKYKPRVCRICCTSYCSEEYVRNRMDVDHRLRLSGLSLLNHWLKNDYTTLKNRDLSGTYTKRLKEFPKINKRRVVNVTSKRVYSDFLPNP